LAFDDAAGLIGDLYFHRVAARTWRWQQEHCSNQENDMLEDSSAGF
jgi:hypothetical protein